MADTVRIVTWNAAQAVHRKLPVLVERLQPDIAIVPECAQPDILEQKLGVRPWSSVAWVGDKPQKGLAVFAFGDFELTQDEAWIPDLHWTLPVNVTGPADFSVLAVWAKNHRAAAFPDGYKGVSTGLAAFELYESWLLGRTVVVGGDFNHNAIWDKPSRPRRLWSATTATAERLGLESAYHRLTGAVQGKEPDATLYFRKAEDEPFHVDHMFAPARLLGDDASISVGTYDDWVTDFSDHVPMVLDLPLLTAKEAFYATQV